MIQTKKVACLVNYFHYEAMTLKITLNFLHTEKNQKSH